MGDYDCWGDDKEDLKAKVCAKVISDGMPTTFVLRLTGGGSSSRSSGPWRVIVKCSKGHENSFEGYGLP